MRLTIRYETHAGAWLQTQHIACDDIADATARVDRVRAWRTGLGADCRLRWVVTEDDTIRAEGTIVDRELRTPPMDGEAIVAATEAALYGEVRP